MFSHREIITVETTDTEEILNITDRVRDLVEHHSLKEGMVSVFPLHTSSAVIINDSDPNLLSDLRDLMSQLVPDSGDYRHNDTDPKQNATAHLKSILTGHHVTIPVSDRTLDLGQYQTIYYAEFDGQRPKEILVKLIGETG